jgi:hypothetical protein
VLILCHQALHLPSTAAAAVAPAAAHRPPAGAFAMGTAGRTGSSIRVRIRGAHLWGRGGWRRGEHLQARSARSVRVGIRARRAYR